MVGRAAAVLRAPRVAAFVALAAALAAYYAGSESLWRAGRWWDIAWLSFVLIPAVFGLVWLVLPFVRARGLVAIALAFGAVAAIAEISGAGTVANFAKLGGITAAAFWFLGWFETLPWVVFVATLIPFVDAYSVWRGPTHDIVTKKKEIFTELSFLFPVPGEHAWANLGLPDLLFFALFLAACVRFGLRTSWTWLAMVASFGVTLALSVEFNRNGLAALPGLSIAFLAVNADLLWRALRAARAAPR